MKKLKLNRTKKKIKIKIKSASYELIFNDYKENYYQNLIGGLRWAI